MFCEEEKIRVIKKITSFIVSMDNKNVSYNKKKRLDIFLNIFQTILEEGVGRFMLKNNENFRRVTKGKMMEVFDFRERVEDGQNNRIINHPAFEKAEELDVVIYNIEQGIEIEDQL
jgi:hypothetical protein